MHARSVFIRAGPGAGGPPRLRTTRPVVVSCDVDAFAGQPDHESRARPCPLAGRSHRSHELLDHSELKAEQDQLEKTGVKFRAVLRAVNEGGRLEVSGSELVVSKANAVTLLIVAATDYRGGDPATACDQYLARAAKPYATLKSAHLADHEKLFRRVDVVLAPPAGDPTVESLPIDERLARYKK